MNNLTSMRVRASRFVSERYRLRERPGFFADLFCWGLIVIIVMWPLFSLAHAMKMLR